MPRITKHATSSILALDADVRLTHYRLQKLGEQQLDLAKGDVVKLSAASEAGTGATDEDKKKRPSEIVEKMNDLFFGDLTEADMVGYVTTLKGKLVENDTLARQAAANIEEQFATGDFKNILTDIVLNSQEAHNSIADQLQKAERIFAAMQGLVSKML